MGTRSTATEETFGLYFSGHLVLKSILDRLDQTAGLKEAEEIILSGASAGGLGMWPNIGYISKRYPRARVSALGIASFYFFATYYNGPDVTDPGTMADFR